MLASSPKSIGFSLSSNRDEGENFNFLMIVQIKMIPTTLLPTMMAIIAPLLSPLDLDFFELVLSEAADEAPLGGEEEEVGILLTDEL